MKCQRRRSRSHKTKHEKSVPQKSSLRASKQAEPALEKLSRKTAKARHTVRMGLIPCRYQTITKTTTSYKTADKQIAKATSCLRLLLPQTVDTQIATRNRETNTRLNSLRSRHRHPCHARRRGLHSHGGGKEPRGELRRLLISLATTRGFGQILRYARNKRKHPQKEDTLYPTISVDKHTHRETQK